jgi:ribosomal protein S18 acetylase RimI-like enzyme
MKIAYRRLRPSNAAQYREIRLESLKAHPEAFGASYEEQAKMPKLMFEAAIEEPVDERFVVGAFDGEDLVGIFGYVPFAMDESLDAGRAGTLIQMYVRPAYRGKKIGLGLTKAVVEEAFKDPEIREIVLGVKEGNVRAIRVYEEAGFRTYRTGVREEKQDECGRWMIIDKGTFQEVSSFLEGSGPPATTGK